MNRVTLYILGTILLIAGLAYGASLLGVPLQWIALGGLIILGLGIMGAASSAKGSAKTNIDVHEQ